MCELHSAEFAWGMEFYTAVSLFYKVKAVSPKI